MTEPLIAEVETTLASGNGHTDPAQVRPRLAEAAAASLDDIQAALLDAAVGATREMWVTTACSGRGKKQRVEVKVPDVRSRVAAIELLLREGLGRPPQAEEAASPRMPRTAEAVEKLGWHDLKMIFAATPHSGAGWSVVCSRVSGGGVRPSRLERSSKRDATSPR